ncbi:MAG: hydrolase, alpha/beta fold family [Myxococcales bacterium]|nr:hydrolase, alpha/beta fold family [Myxococcales bacterium]
MTNPMLCACIKSWGMCLMPWCICLMAAGCVHFQKGPSEPIAAEERLLLGARGQLRVIDKNPSKATEAVLLVHGYGSSSASYAPVIDALTAHFRVLAIDLPGFGKSDRREGDYSPEALADVLAEVLAQKGIARAHVVGHSWGSSVVLAFARRHPDKLHRLVVISGWVYDEQLIPFMRWARMPGVGEALYGTFYRQNIGERLYLNFVDPSLVTQKVVDEVEKQMALEGAVAAALAAVRGMQFHQSEGDYRSITHPTLLVWGREDHVARLPFGERLAREMPHARLVVLPRCGHIPMWECSGETAAALTEFLSAK